MNFDGLVGPTHNYAGLSVGNIASTSNKGRSARPKEAALQGLAKMRFLYDLGGAQGVFPPAERPQTSFLRSLGFEGTDQQVLEAAAKKPPLLAVASSASSMWTANAATVTPSFDSLDGKAHFTPANLASKAHRSLEVPQTSLMLRRVFADPEFFVHHDALPPSFPDEGAANHTRLVRADGRALHVFTYGRSLSDPQDIIARRFPARQLLEASEAVARRHGIKSEVVFVRQHASAIDEGVFHNDVISVGNEDLLLAHEGAFAEGELAKLNLSDGLRYAEISKSQLSVSGAVKSYLFNSQLVKIGDEIHLVAPSECETGKARDCVDWLLASNCITHVHFADLRQSMRNGGGPACLRLRVPMTEMQRRNILPGAMFAPELHFKLAQWVERHYRDELLPEDLLDPQLILETRIALDELTGLMGLGSDYYPFQRP